MTYAGQDWEPASKIFWRASFEPEPPKGFTDEELLAVYPKLFAFAIKIVRRNYGLKAFFGQDKDRAHDLLQNTVVKMLRSRHQFQPGTNLFSWGARIMQNLAKDEQETAGAAPPICSVELLSEEEHPGQDAPQDQAHSLWDAQHILSCMSPIRSQTLLHSLDGTSYAEIAEQTGTEVKNVKTRLYRAREQFAREMESGMPQDTVRVVVDNGVNQYEGQVRADVPPLCLKYERNPELLAEFWSNHLCKDIQPGRGIVWSVKYDWK